jgi:hypothetical protein
MPVKNNAPPSIHKSPQQSDGAADENMLNPPDSHSCARAYHGGVGQTHRRTQHTRSPLKYLCIFVVSCPLVSLLLLLQPRGGGAVDAMMYLKNEQRAVQWSGVEKLRNKGMTHATDRQHSTVAILLCICFYGSAFLPMGTA